MSHRRTPINYDTGTLIIDGKNTTIRAYSEETHRQLQWQKKLTGSITYKSIPKPVYQGDKDYVPDF
jgi:hypothetical protein